MLQEAIAFFTISPQTVVALPSKQEGLAVADHPLAEWVPSEQADRVARAVMVVALVVISNTLLVEAAAHLLMDKTE